MNRPPGTHEVPVRVQRFMSGSLSSGIEIDDQVRNTCRMNRTRIGRRAAFTSIALAIAAVGLGACTNAAASPGIPHDVAATIPSPNAASNTATPVPTPSATPTPTETPPPPFVKLTPGMKGAAVTALQQKLTALGYWAG